MVEPRLILFWVMNLSVSYVSLKLENRPFTLVHMMEWKSIGSEEIHVGSMSTPTFTGSHLQDTRNVRLPYRGVPAWIRCYWPRTHDNSKTDCVFKAFLCREVSGASCTPKNACVCLENGRSLVRPWVPEDRSPPSPLLPARPKYCRWPAISVGASPQRAAGRLQWASS